MKNPLPEHPQEVYRLLGAMILSDIPPYQGTSKKSIGDYYMERLDRITKQTIIGYAVELLAKSPSHRQYQLREYLDINIFPALKARQVKFYLNDHGIPTGMVTWAWLNEEVESDIHASGRVLALSDWKCGDRLFFNDWISPYGNTREILLDMMINVFPNESGCTYLKRNQDGSLRKVKRWTRDFASRAEKILNQQLPPKNKELS